MYKNITNPIFHELQKLNIIKKSRVKTISQKTRDKKIRVFQDKESKIIFLEKYSKINYYKKKLKVFKKNKFNNFKKKIIDDDLRRYKQFKNQIKKKNVLDFGCGWGNFLNKISKKAKNVCGVEVRSECIDYIKKKIKLKVYNNLDDVEYKFNLITMFHVLEHIPHQVKILKALKKKLNKNGKIIIEVPHAKDFLIECLNIKEFKNFTFWSEHLVLHTIKSLEKVIKKAGFKKIKLIYFQRYNINNHFGWIIKGKPGGHDFYKKLFGKNFQERYEVFLKKKGYTDTIIATAEN